MNLARTLAIVGIAVVGNTAHADVDWAKGLVTATAAGVADRHAPSPSVARGTSRRGAEDAAKKLLAAEVAKLPLAAGGTVAGQAAAKDRIARAVDAALTIDAEPETDGSWRVTLAVPIEAVRQAIAGPRTLDPKGDSGPPIVIVDGVKVKPSVGWTVGGIAAAT
ncbi:MAG TPA: hypothetical protein VGO00_27445, partial [Kofleriaceae bacterium]|nr:hypothetical protein [Kofleriaceae bacterium]